MKLKELFVEGFIFVKYQSRKESVCSLFLNNGKSLNAFINNLKGGRKLRRRVRAAMKTQADTAKAQIAKEKTAANESLKGG